MAFDPALVAIREALRALPMGAEGIVAVEEIGRIVDAARVRAAGSMDAASAESLGFATPAAAVATLARVSERTARSRVTIAAATQPGRSLSGSDVAPRYPALAEALDAVSLDGAELVVRELDSVAGRVAPDTLSAAESLMVNLVSGLDATGSHPVAPVSVTAVSGEIRRVTATIDPDGARPREVQAARRRALRIGQPDELGGSGIGGYLTGDVRGLLLGLLEAHRRSPRFAESATDSGGAADPRTPDRRAFDPRTPDQRRHDTLAELLSAAARATDAPNLDGVPVTVIVTTTAESLADDGGRAGDPIGVIVGSDSPVSRATLERLIDNSGYREVALSRTGRVLGISSLQRCFTTLQRHQIAARDGYRCATPGKLEPALLAPGAPRRRLARRRPDSRR